MYRSLIHQSLNFQPCINCLRSRSPPKIAPMTRQSSAVLRAFSPLIPPEFDVDCAQGAIIQRI